MKVALPGIPLFAVLTFINLGCATEKPKAQGSVLDVSPTSVAVTTPSTPAPLPAAYSGPTYSSPTYSRPGNAKPAQPAPVIAEPVAVAPPPSTPSRVSPRAVPATANAKTYVVRQGDTLSAIARMQYGDSRKWIKIAAANPNLNPDALKEGQTIVVPQ